MDEIFCLNRFLRIGRLDFFLLTILSQWSYDYELKANGANMLIFGAIRLY